jgi:hypothetical protein
MDLTDEDMALLYTAWVLARDNKGMAIADDHVPMAHRLAEAGWLERVVTEDDLTWWWSKQAEVALRTGALVTDAQNRQN